MLSLYVSRKSVNELAAQSISKHWLDYVMKKHHQMALRAAALVRDNGKVAAGTENFKIQVDDFMGIKKAMHEESTEKISFRGVSYCIKHLTSSQLVAFNGRHYIIASKAERMYIIAYCESRKSSGTAAKWLNKVAKKLKDRYRVA